MNIKSVVSKPTRLKWYHVVAFMSGTVTTAGRVLAGASSASTYTGTNEHIVKLMADWQTYYLGIFKSRIVFEYNDKAFTRIDHEDIVSPQTIAFTWIDSATQLSPYAVELRLKPGNPLNIDGEFTFTGNEINLAEFKATLKKNQVNVSEDSNVYVDPFKQESTTAIALFSIVLMTVGVIVTLAYYLK
jgi:hypothetical protein